MGVTACLFAWPGWKHKVLWIEAIEIFLFASFWIVQTRELWHSTLRSRASGQQAQPDRSLAASRP
jgi:hypothetical protein